MSVCLSDFLNGLAAATTVENVSNVALVPRSPEMKPELAAVGSTTVAVLSQSSGVAAVFGNEAGSRNMGHNKCALYMYKLCRGFYCCSK